MEERKLIIVKLAPKKTHLAKRQGGEKVKRAALIRECCALLSDKKTIVNSTMAVMYGGFLLVYDDCLEKFVNMFGVSHHVYKYTDNLQMECYKVEI